MVTIEEQPGRPCLDLSALKDITVRAGETIEIKIPFTGGNPKPIAEVFNRNQEVYEDERTKIEVRSLHYFMLALAFQSFFKASAYTFIFLFFGLS